MIETAYSPQISLTHAIDWRDVDLTRSLPDPLKDFFFFLQCNLFHLQL